MMLSAADVVPPRRVFIAVVVVPALITDPMIMPAPVLPGARVPVTSVPMNDRIAQTRARSSRLAISSTVLPFLQKVSAC